MWLTSRLSKVQRHATVGALGSLLRLVQRAKDLSLNTSRNFCNLYCLCVSDRMGLHGCLYNAFGSGDKYKSSQELCVGSKIWCGTSICTNRKYPTIGMCK